MLGEMRAARILLGFAGAALLLGPAATAAPNRPQATLSPLEAHVLSDINVFRHAHHLAPLRLSTKLDAAARAHTMQMARDGYFAHESADGSSFWKRIQQFYASGPWGYWSVGENLLWSSPRVSASRALRIWLHSPAHRANLMSARWREIGIAAVHEAAAPGVYRGRPVTILTTDFGVRR